MSPRTPTLRRKPDASESVSARVRVDRRTKDLVKRVQPGEIAVVDHRDIDRISAEELIAARVCMVWNVAPSTSGTYPNSGPLLLVRAGIPLFQVVDGDPFASLSDGELVTVANGTMRAGGTTVATASELLVEDLEQSFSATTRKVGDALSEFAHNTVELIQTERALVYGELDVPDVRTDMRDREVLVVVRGYDYREDLRALRVFVRDTKPILIAVDGGADALLQLGLTPHIVCGDMDSVSDDALRRCGERVVHAYPDGRAPGADRLRALGLDYTTFPVAATSEDAAMLLAFEKGARLIVAVGTHLNLVEFLDKSRRGMASTFLTRLRIGERLVDAKGVSALYRPRASLRGMVALLAGAFLCLAAVVAGSPALGETLELFLLTLRNAL